MVVANLCPDSPIVFKKIWGQELPFWTTPFMLEPFFLELPFSENFSIVMTGVGCLLTQNTLDSNFMVGLAPQKKAPATHQLCSKTIGKMLLEVDLWGPFFGMANHQENYKL